MVKATDFDRFSHKKQIVGVGEMIVSNDPSHVLCTFALGSCIGLTLYDPLRKTGGIMHVMLPHSSIAKEKSKKHPFMFVDTGFPLLLRAMESLNTNKRNLQVFIAGGACMMGSVDHFKIGERNLKEIKRALQHENLHIAAEETGGFNNRTVFLSLKNGWVKVKEPANEKVFQLGNPLRQKN